MDIRLFPYREGIANGNIVWAERDRGSAYYRVSRFAMHNGKFPPDHPTCPGGGDSSLSAEVGKSEKIDVFRARGYWASCFPEGDGITWRPLRGQDDDRCLVDINECFGWSAKWALA